TQTLDQRGQTLSISDEIGSRGTVTRDANGRIVQTTNGLGNETSYTYDQNGNLLSTQDSLGGPFLPPRDFSLGPSQIIGLPGLGGTAVGDVNSDGAPDIVAITSQGNAEVLQNTKNAAGKPTGTFTVGSTLSLHTFVKDMPLGDVNGDGKLDLVTMNPAGVGVSFGAGNGTFASPVVSPMGTNPVALVVADFNGDRRADVATADQSDHSVSVRLANSDGTLGPVATYDVGGPQSALAVGDVNGDGVPDLVTVDEMGTS